VDSDQVVADALQPIRAATDEHNPSPEPGEVLGRRPAQARGRARHEGRSPAEGSGFRVRPVVQQTADGRPSSMTASMAFLMIIR
jgi:hypothetical protein